MASLEILGKEEVINKKTVERLLSLFQTCEGKDSLYLEEKGHIQVQDIYLILINALKSADNSVLPETVVAVGQFLYNVSWIGTLTEEQSGDILLELCSIIEKTKEKAICSRALWCFYSQNLNAKIISSHIKPILKAFSKAVGEKQVFSSSVEFEATRALKSFLSTIPQDVLMLSEMWWKDCLVRTVHPATRVRDMALSIIKDYRHMLAQNSHVMQIVSSEIKSTIVPGMLKLFSENAELYVLKLWQSIVNLCGKIIHQGSSLINSLLLVIEKAFKCTSDDIRLACFACWQELISNFAIAPEVIGNVKRLRLIMQPLRGKNAKSEISLKAKVDTWWHLISCLGLNKNSYELVFEPLIQFCFGIGDIAGKPGFGGAKSRSSFDVLNASTSSSSSCGTANEAFSAQKLLLVELGVEILGRFFESCSTSSTVKLPRSLARSPLHHDIILNSSVFMNHSEVLLRAIEITTCMPVTDKDNLSLVPYIWLNLTNHLKSLLENSGKKPELYDLVSCFFRTVEAVATCDAVDNKTLMSILEFATSLPVSVLQSSSYNLRPSNKRNDTPGFVLLDLLLSKNMVDKFGYSAKFMALFNRLTTFSSPSPVSVLNLFHASLQIVISRAVAHIIKDDLLYKLWMSLSTRLVEFVEESQEVNQGDSLEHDFSCMHAVLIFPFQHFIWKLAVKRSVLKKWETLYQVFARCAAVVAGVDANACCVEFASKFRAAVPENLQLEGIEDMIYVIDTLLRSIHWSMIKKHASEKERGHSWMRKKAAEVFVLAPVIQLIGDIIDSFIRIVDNLEKTSKSHCVDIASTFVGYFETIFEKLENGNVIHVISQLSPYLVEIIRLSCNFDSVFADPKVLIKIEDVWEKLTKSLQLNYHGAYDTTLLNMLSPLLEVTFSHKKHSIQMDTRLFWQGTFGSSYDLKLIPDSLRKVIENLKPAIGMDNTSLDDKTSMSSSESKTGVIEESISEMSSSKASGSFLNKFKSQSSAKKLFSSPKGKFTPKSKGIEEMSAKEFVVINSSPNKVKRRVLTEHQKEVASRRSLIPAMYVDLSQDSCMIPTESNDVEDSQQTVDSHKVSEDEMPELISLDLNKENCGSKSHIGEATLFGGKSGISCLDSSLETNNQSTSKSPNTPHDNTPCEIHNGDHCVNVCISEGSDKANIAPSIPQLCGQNGDSPHESATDTNAAKSAFLNLHLDSVNTDDSTANTTSKTTNRRSSRKKSEVKPYFPKRCYATRKKNAVESSEHSSCDFVAETCEFKETVVVDDSQGMQTRTSFRKNGRCNETRGKVSRKSKEADSKTVDKNSDELLKEIGMDSLPSVSVICEVMPPEMVFGKGPKPVVKSGTARLESDNSKALPVPDSQDSVIVISSSSSLEANPSLDMPLMDPCKKRVPASKQSSARVSKVSLTKRSPGGKSRKSDRLTEEEVLSNIRARKRKYEDDSSIDCSPHTKAMRKKRTSNCPKSLNPAGTESSLENSFENDAQVPYDNLISLTMEGDTHAVQVPPVSLTTSVMENDAYGILDSMGNSDSPVAAKSTCLDENMLEVQQDVSATVSKSSVDHPSSVNMVAVGSEEASELVPENSVPANVIEPRCSPKKLKKSITSDNSTISPTGHHDYCRTVQAISLPNGDEVTSGFEHNEETAGLPALKPTILKDSVSELIINAKPKGWIALNPELAPASPTISPNGIMKKTGAASKTATPTPPHKRKVSFADPPVQGKSPHSLPTRKTPVLRIVNRRLHMPKNCLKDSVSEQSSIDLTQGSYHSPMITDLNFSDCVCPSLISSKEPIDILIPHLTPSLHGRGLSKLLSSRNIKTVGDLSALTEADVHTLPIKSPKLSVLRKALFKVSGDVKSINGAGCQSATGTVATVEDDHAMAVLSTESRPANCVNNTPEKEPDLNTSTANECIPLPSLEDEMADESLCQNNTDDVTDVQPCFPDKVQSTTMRMEVGSDAVAVEPRTVAVNDDLAVTSESAKGSPQTAKHSVEETKIPAPTPFNDIYQFLDTRFAQTTPAQLRQLSGSQIQELIAYLGTFSTKVSEAWLDSKCNAAQAETRN